MCLLPSVRRGVMPRRGWTVAPDGWVQFIRGPRPPAQRWPMAQGNRQPPEPVVVRRAAVPNRPGHLFSGGHPQRGGRGQAIRMSPNVSRRGCPQEYCQVGEGIGSSWRVGGRSSGGF